MPPTQDNQVVNPNNNRNRNFYEIVAHRDPDDTFDPFDTSLAIDTTGMTFDEGFAVPSASGFRPVTINSHEDAESHELNESFDPFDATLLIDTTGLTFSEDCTLHAQLPNPRTNSNDGAAHCGPFDATLPVDTTVTTCD